MTTEPAPDNETPARQTEIPGLSPEESKKAAELIQRTYRGHRARRQVNGFGLDADTRWTEALKAAKYQKVTEPQAPDATSPDQSVRSPAQTRWNKVTEIAKHAGQDDDSLSPSDVSVAEASDSTSPPERTPAEKEERRERKALAKEKRKRTAKMMDLQYFLEMVDHKHRYGSSLRKYHNYWKTQDTNQSFFYWLDQGDGKDIELDECSRARLDKEQVRYLSREERLHYLVKVDSQGKLVWAKNGEAVWTKDELYKDSVTGIVPKSDPTPEYKYNKEPAHQPDDDEADSSDDDSDDSDSSSELERYVDEEFHRAKGPAKLKYVSAGVFFNHMIRSSLKKGHKWIFVCDTSFHLYIGYKQSGAFQHSSFLNGSRILAAGLIKVKRGQLRRLSPLSGHYRPPAQNFRAFVHSLEDEGVDMSRVSISRSYAVLVGLEGYVKTRRKIKSAESTVTRQVDKVVRPEKVKEEDERAQDKSQSAEKERQYLARQQGQKQAILQQRKNEPRGISRRLSTAWGRITGKTSAIENQGVAEERGVPGTGPEDGVPAPDGRLDRFVERQKDSKSSTSA